MQYTPAFSHYKIYIDEHHNPGDFWLTGSQIFHLMNDIQESLAARVALLYMSPLSQGTIKIIEAPPKPFTTDFQENLNSSQTIKAISAPTLFGRIWKGSMPRVCSNTAEDINVYYSSYLSTYIERDVRDLLGAIDALKFSRFITVVAARTAQLIDYKVIVGELSRRLKYISTTRDLFVTLRNGRLTKSRRLEQ